MAQNNSGLENLSIYAYTFNSNAKYTVGARDYTTKGQFKQSG